MPKKYGLGDVTNVESKTLKDTGKFSAPISAALQQEIKLFCVANGYTNTTFLQAAYKALKAKHGK